MRVKVLAGLLILLFLVVGCGKSSYFGVKNKAIGVPPDFEQTEAAIKKAEASGGAQYCPEKIARAKVLARRGVEEYWKCHTEKGLALLAEARKLAKEAELCKAPPPPPPKPKKMVPPPPPKKMIILNNVLFDFDKYNIRPDAKTVLDEVVKELKKYPEVVVEVAGHTDSTGPAAYNQKLSERRANSVKKYLVAHGIAPSRLITKGYGETRPVATNKTREGRQLNRRVEFTILKR